MTVKRPITFSLNFCTNSLCKYWATNFSVQLNVTKIIQSFKEIDGNCQRQTFENGLKIQRATEYRNNELEEKVAESIIEDKKNLFSVKLDKTQHFLDQNIINIRGNTK